MRRMDYSVLGDTVNTAARLEKVGGPGQIVIGENTFNEVKDQFIIEPIGTHTVKGKKEKINAYRVIGEKVTQSAQGEINAQKNV